MTETLSLTGWRRRFFAEFEPRRQLVHDYIDMTSEEDCKQLYQMIVANYKDYHLTQEELDQFFEAESDLLHSAPGTYEDTPYRMLIRIIFTSLELKAHQLKQRFLEKLSEIPIDQLPVVCNKCDKPLKEHDNVKCDNFHDAGTSQDRPGL